MSLHGFTTFLADAAPVVTQPNPTGERVQLIGMMVIFGVIFYVLMVRPQSKKAKEHAALLKTMKPGDKVVTNSGVVGIIVSVKEKTVAIRSADTKLEFLKSAVSEISERSSETGAVVET